MSLGKPRGKIKDKRKEEGTVKTSMLLKCKASKHGKIRSVRHQHYTYIEEI